MQSGRMESNWAAEHLQVIRTLMERAAVYRRALAPIMTLTGALGTIAALLGWRLNIRTPSAFAGYLVAVRLLALAGRPPLGGTPAPEGGGAVLAPCPPAAAPGP